MDDNIWIKLWRKTIESTVFQHDGMFKLWCLCLMKVSHIKQEFFMDGVVKPVIIKPGEFITGRYQLHSDYHQLHLRRRKPKKLPLPSPDTLRRWLLTLQEMQMLHIKTTNKYSVISITNWKRHQQPAQQLAQRLHNGCTTAAHNKNDKNDKKIEYTQNFLIFLKAYPGTKNKDYAFQCWQKKAKERPSLEIILKAITKQVMAKSANNKAGKWTPEWRNASTWINQGGWNDEVATYETKTTPTSQNPKIDLKEEALAKKQTKARLEKLTNQLKGIP